MQTFCPLNIDLLHKKCLVIGGGKVAERKVSLLSSYGAVVTIVSPALTPELQRTLDRGEISYIADLYRPAYLKEAFMVICATGDHAVNRQAAGDCHKRGIPVNSVGEPDCCSVFFPALMKKGPVTIAVSTSGAGPALARRIRDELKEDFKPEYTELASFLGEIRRMIIARICEPESRKELFRYLAGDEFIAYFKNKDREKVITLVEQLIAAREKEVSS